MRHGRGFPLGTQYHSAVRTVPTNPVSGSATMTLTANPALTLVVVPSTIVSESVRENRFRSTLVPPLVNFEEVQRQIQRTQDEIARAVNPLRTVADGGTGLGAVTPGALVTGTGSAAMETVPVGAANEVLVSDGVMPRWSGAPPTWRRFAVVFGDFSTAGLTFAKTIYSLPARQIVQAAVIKHSAAFTGGAIATYTIGIGVSGTPTKYTPALNVFAAPSNTGFAQSPTGLTSVENMGAAVNIIATATSTGANLNAATAGAAEIWLLLAALPTS